MSAMTNVWAGLSDPEEKGMGGRVLTLVCVGYIYIYCVIFNDKTLMQTIEGNPE